MKLRKIKQHSGVSAINIYKEGGVECGISIPLENVSGVNYRYPYLSRKMERRIMNSFSYRRAIRQIFAAANYSSECAQIAMTIVSGGKPIFRESYIQDNIGHKLIIPLKKKS